MLLNRTADGRQIANPDKFPHGFKFVADYIHSLGLKSGL
jgi:alpha-galactosidase